MLERDRQVRDAGASSQPAQRTAARLARSTRSFAELQSQSGSGCAPATQTCCGCNRGQDGSELRPAEHSLQVEVGSGTCERHYQRRPRADLVDRQQERISTAHTADLGQRAGGRVPHRRPPRPQEWREPRNNLFHSHGTGYPGAPRRHDGVTRSQPVDHGVGRARALNSGSDVPERNTFGIQGRDQVDEQAGAVDVAVMQIDFQAVALARDCSVEVPTYKRSANSEAGLVRVRSWCAHQQSRSTARDSSASICRKVRRPFPCFPSRISASARAPRVISLRGSVRLRIVPVRAASSGFEPSKATSTSTLRLSVRSTAVFITAGLADRLSTTTVNLSSGVPSFRKMSIASAALLTADSSGAVTTMTCWVRSSTASVESSIAMPMSTTTYRKVLRRTVTARAMRSGVTSSDSSGRRAPGRIIGPPEW